MSSKNQKAQWWQVYLMLPLLAGLFVVEIRLGLKGALNIAAQLGILFLVYAFIQLWVRANRQALMRLDEEAGERQFRVHELAAADLAEAREAAREMGERPVVHVPESQLKGVPSTTLEMDELESYGRHSRERKDVDDTKSVVTDQSTAATQ